MHVHLEELAVVAREALQVADFSSVPFEVRYDDQGDTRVCVISLSSSARNSNIINVRSMRVSKQECSNLLSLGSFWSLFACSSGSTSSSTAEEHVML